MSRRRGRSAGRLGDEGGGGPDVWATREDEVPGDEGRGGPDVQEITKGRTSKRRPRDEGGEGPDFQESRERKGWTPWRQGTTGCPGDEGRSDFQGMREGRMSMR